MSKLSRTYSSPSLRANIFRRAQSPRFDTVGNQQGLESQWKNRVSHLYNDHYERDEEEFYVIGDRVLVDGHKSASVAYFGEVEFASGDWVGVVMDNPLGNHNGKVHGREYFQCAPFHGLFVRPHRVTRMPDSAIGSGRSSRTSTPLPTLHQRPYCNSADSRRTYGSGSPAPSSVTTDSYFYDDDYRQSRLPTIASLGQRIDEIEANPASRPPSRLSPAAPVGILKKTSSSYQNSGRPRSRSETRQDRGEADHTGYDPRVPVFNFRPRRAQLDQLQHDLTRAEESTGILSDASNRANAVVVDSSSLNVGDRVYVRSDRGEMSGTLRFMGETNFATGEWAGIELDQADGKNDGSVLGYRYFCCPQKYGLFVPATRVRKQQNSIGYKAVRSTIKSPPPLKTTISNYASISNNDSSNGSSRSMTPSSYYSDKTTPSPVNEYPSHRYSSSSSDINSLREDISDGLMDTFKQFFSDANKMESPKFDDDDIDYLLKRSLLRKGKETQEGISSLNEVKLRPKCVKYTFSSSKYDGNPIARRTVEYD